MTFTRSAPLVIRIENRGSKGKKKVVFFFKGAGAMGGGHVETRTAINKQNNKEDNFKFKQKSILAGL